MHIKKDVILTYTFCLFICCLLFIYSASAVHAAKEGMQLWYNSVMPALLPFFVCASILQNVGFPHFDKASQIFICFISGAPAAAKLIGSDSTNCTRAVAVLNTVSPMFVYAAFCCGMLKLPRLAVPIIAAQISSALIMLCILKPHFPQRRQQSISPLKLLSRGLTSSVPAMLGICAAMVFFMAVMAVVNETGLLMPFHRLISGVIGSDAADVLYVLFTGLLEMVSGAKAISRLNLSAQMTAALSAFIFSFGGVCIFAQSITLCSLSFRAYFSTKLLQASLSALLAYVFTLLSGNSQWVFNTIAPETLASNALSLLLTLGVSLAAMSLVIMLGAAARLRKRK